MLQFAGREPAGEGITNSPSTGWTSRLSFRRLLPTSLRCIQCHRPNSSEYFQQEEIESGSEVLTELLEGLPVALGW